MGTQGFSRFPNDTISQVAQRAGSVLSSMYELKRPFVIEFAGSPKAGKTTVLHSLELFLRRNNFEVQVITERASVCPVDRKDHMFFNTWTTCTSLAQILEFINSESHVILLDRGLFDSLCWFNWMSMTGRLSEEEQKVIENFILLDRWRKKIDLVLAFIAEETQSLEREYQLVPTKSFGTIMNPFTLEVFKQAIERTVSTVGDHFKRIDMIDTSNLKRPSVK